MASLTDKYDSCVGIGKIMGFSQLMIARRYDDLIKLLLRAGGYSEHYGSSTRKGGCPTALGPILAALARNVGGQVFMSPN